MAAMEREGRVFQRLREGRDPLPEWLAPKGVTYNTNIKPDRFELAQAQLATGAFLLEDRRMTWRAAGFRPHYSEMFNKMVARRWNFGKLEA